MSTNLYQARSKALHAIAVMQWMNMSEKDRILELVRFIREDLESLDMSDQELLLLLYPPDQPPKPKETK